MRIDKHINELREMLSRRKDLTAEEREAIEKVLEQHVVTERFLKNLLGELNAIGAEI